MTSLHVGNLHPDLTDSDLFETFEYAGPLDSVKLCRDWNTDQSRGYGYVNFQEPAHAQWALENFNGEFLMGRRLRISRSRNERRAAAPEDIRDKIKAIRNKVAKDNKEQHDTKCSAPCTEKKEAKADRAAAPEELPEKPKKRMRKNKEQRLPECSAPSTENKEQKADHAAAPEDLREIDALKNKTGNDKEQHVTECSAPCTEKKEAKADYAAAPEEQPEKKEEKADCAAAPEQPEKKEEKADCAAAPEEQPEKPKKRRKKNKAQRLPECYAPSMENKELTEESGSAVRSKNSVKPAPTDAEDLAAAVAEYIHAIRVEMDNKEQHVPKCTAPSTMKKKMDLGEESGSAVINRDSIKPAPATYTEARAASALRATVGASRLFQQAMGGVKLQASKCPMPVVSTTVAEAQLDPSAIRITIGRAEDCNREVTNEPAIPEKIEKENQDKSEKSPDADNKQPEPETRRRSAVRRMLKSCRRALSRAAQSIRAAFRRRSSAK